MTLVPFGATIISWVVDGHEVIFMSKTSAMDGSKAIRGGVPICFPNFGPWSFGPQHGFARNSKDWRIRSDPTVDELTGDAEIALELKDTEDTRKMWQNNKFTLLYRITLKEKSLNLSVTVHNEGEQEFDLTFCFHTYLKTSDLANVGVTCLKNVTYTDKTKEGQPQIAEDQDPVKIVGFTDRVYTNAPDTLTVQVEKNRSVKLTKSNMADFVVWNPHETAAKMADMHENGYLEFVCVEATQASERVVIQPGKHWEASHSMELEKQ